MMRVHVVSAGVIAPGLADWRATRAVLAGEAPLVAAEVAAPVPTSLPPAERRRSSPTVRLALAAAEQALAATSLAPADMAMVFSSQEAAGLITHQLCEVLAGSREVSPTQFHNSVHNAPSGYYSIAMGAKRGADSICRGPWSFAAGLLDAVSRVAADRRPVLYVCYDSPLPAPLSDAMPVTESTAIALVLAPESEAGQLASWQLSLSVAATEAPWPSWMPASWHANASCRGFAALAALLPGVDGATLPLSPELALELARC